MIKITTVAHVDDDLAKAWLQHLRDFDTAHPGCHFQVYANTPNKSLAEIEDIMRDISPGFDHILVARKQ